MSAVPAETPALAGTPKLTLEDLLYEPALMLGSGSAVMLQLAEWGVGKGVAEHSTTLQRPIDRLRTTLTYIYVMGLGTEEEQQQVARMVNRAHGPVKGEGYTAFDPQLQLWVASTLAEVAVQMWEKLDGPLDEVTKEHLYRQGQIYGNALQVKPEMWPADRRAFDEYWVQTEAGFRSDEQIRRYARSLLSAKAQKWYIKPGIATISLITRGNLTAHTREVLGLPWSERDQKRYDRLWSVVRRVYPFVPRWVRRVPARIAMRDIRWRLRTGRRVI